EVCRIDRGYCITRRHRRVVVPAKQISNAPKDVAAIVERNGLQSFAHRHARLKIENCERVATHWYRKRVQDHRLLVLVDKNSLGNDYLSRTCLFKTKTAQGGGAAGKEAFADWQRQIDFINFAIAVAVAWVEKICQTQRCVGRKHRCAKLIQLVISAITSLKSIKGKIAARLSQGNCVVNVEEGTAGCVQLIVATDFTRCARFLVGIANGAQQTSVASFTRVT